MQLGTKKLIFLFFLFSLSLTFVIAEDIYIDFTNKNLVTWTYPPKYNVEYIGYSTTDWNAISLTNTSFLTYSYYPTDIDDVYRIAVYQAVNGWTGVDETKSNSSLKTTGLYALNTEETPSIVYDITFSKTFTILDIQNLKINFLYSNNEGGTLYGNIALLYNDIELTAVRNQTGLVVGNYKNMSFSYSKSNITFNRLIFGMWNNDVGTNNGFEYVAQGITLNNITNSNSWNATGNETYNYMPTGSFSANSSYCINSTYIGNENLTFNIKTNYTDIEGDTIYYQLKTSDYGINTISDRIYFSTLNTPPTANKEFFNLVNFVYENGTTHIITSDTQTALWQLGYSNYPDGNLVIFQYGENTTNGNIYDYALAVEKGSNWGYAINNPSDTTNLHLDLVFPLSPITTNFYLYNELGQPMSSLTFRKETDTTFSIQDENFNTIFNGTIPKYAHIRPYISFTEDTITYIINIQNTSITTIDNLVNLTENQLYTKFNGFTFTTTGIMTYYFLLYNGFFTETSASQTDNTSWTTSLSSSYSMTNAGRKIDLYVTDGPHLANSDYDIYTTYLNIPYCSNLPPSDNNHPPGQNPNEYDFRPDKPIKEYIGNYWSNYYEQMGWTDLAKSTLYWVWLFLFIGSIATNFMITRNIQLTTANAFASSICVILSALLGYLTQLITFLILLAFSLAGPLAKNYYGEDNNEVRP